MASIDDRIAELERELAALKAEVAAEPEEATSRRAVFKVLAAGAAGVAAGMVARAAPAAAADGGSLVIGAGGDANNTGQTRTRLLYTGAALGGTGVDANFVQVRDDSLSGFQPATAGLTSYVNTKAVNGVYGYSQSNGNGVFAMSESGIGLFAWGRGGIGALMQGGRANVQLTPFGTAAPARGDAHTVGELINDAAGDLWYCTVSGTPGVWRKVGGPGTAGQLHALPSPVRVYDSRSGTGPASTGDGPLAGGSSRAVGLASGFVGATLTPAAPPGATAALISLTLDATVASGFLAVFSNAVPWPGNSNVNWYTGGQILAVTTVSVVDPLSRVRVQAGGPGSTHFIVDVIGYFR